MDNKTYENSHLVQYRVHSNCWPLCTIDVTNIFTACFHLFKGNPQVVKFLTLLSIMSIVWRLLVKDSIAVFFALWHFQKLKRNWHYLYITICHCGNLPFRTDLSRLTWTVSCSFSRVRLPSTTHVLQIKVDKSCSTCQYASTACTSLRTPERKRNIETIGGCRNTCQGDWTNTWCLDELIRETPKKFRIRINPSQTVNKTILRPVHQLPTLNEQLHRLYNAKYFALVDAKEGFLQCPLDEESSLMTTMHTSYGRYRWLHLHFGIFSVP